MKRLVFLVFLVGSLAPILPCAAPGFAADFPDVALEISPESGVSSDTVTICRVRATNRSGATLDGRQVGFEASALENGTVVERERGRFGGILRNGESVETLIGFNGVFRTFEVAAAPASGGGRRGSARGSKGTSRSGAKKASAGRKKKKTN